MNARRCKRRVLCIGVGEGNVIWVRAIIGITYTEREVAYVSAHTEMKETHD